MDSCELQRRRYFTRRAKSDQPLSSRFQTGDQGRSLSCRNTASSDVTGLSQTKSGWPHSQPQVLENKPPRPQETEPQRLSHLNRVSEQPTVLDDFLVIDPDCSVADREAKAKVSLGLDAPAEKLIVANSEEDQTGAARIIRGVILVM
jgi:hypothetical protein